MSTIDSMISLNNYHIINDSMIISKLRDFDYLKKFFFFFLGIFINLKYEFQNSKVIKFIVEAQK